MNPFLYDFGDYHEANDQDLLRILALATREKVKVKELGFVYGSTTFVFYVGKQPSKRELTTLLQSYHGLNTVDAKYLLAKGFID